MWKLARTLLGGQGKSFAPIGLMGEPKYTFCYYSYKCYSQLTQIKSLSSLAINMYESDCRFHCNYLGLPSRFGGSRLTLYMYLFPYSTEVLQVN